ncbi:hypothetical protein AVEN_82281-1 [Araneus ventricosus]|uniref:Uncharacterized protein n=1 Tax=Araneus ventricosus TaxID=182803 RepID=A0A4Y2P6L9_ARAVE|nr:hypothetical protein AVEN_82281-1 [Araneus ventricosus]
MQEHFQNYLAPRQEPRPRKVRKTRRRNHAILFSVILAFFFLQSQGLSLKRKLLQTSSLTNVAAQEQRSPPGLFVKRKNCVCSPARQPFFRKSSAPRPRANGQGPLLFQAKTSLSVPDRRQTKNFSHRPQTGVKPPFSVQRSARGRESGIFAMRPHRKSKGSGVSRKFFPC